MTYLLIFKITYPGAYFIWRKLLHFKFHMPLIKCILKEKRKEKIEPLRADI